MKILNKTYLTLLVVIFTFLIVNKSAYAEQKDTVAKRVYVWKNIPVVVICNETATRRELVENAVKYWRDKGYSIGKIIEGVSCKNNIKFGEIRISDSSNLNTSKYYGYTTVREIDRRIIGSIINFDPKYYNDESLIIHELGHAIGLVHAPNSRTQDIMHAYHMTGGRKF